LHTRTNSLHASHLSLSPRTLLHHFSFYIHSSRDHRHLHSFPTRRSSDLARHGGPRRSAPDGSSGSAAGPVSPRGGRARRRLPRRSEEHTSELQSRFDLVCRLLLEKKKKKLTNDRQPIIIII